ncbi:MAG: ABC transporter substrate-binding protein [Clostridiales bacterium]|jgi:peptide/nickel transport system substrate-binding protein|nr:ABC transporter substrate-binding protein [Clostridiales bacterium]
MFKMFKMLKMLKKRRAARVLAALAALALMLSACGGGGASTTEAASTAGADATTAEAAAATEADAAGAADATTAAPAADGGGDEAKYGGTLYFGYPYDLSRPNYIITDDGPGNFVRDLAWDPMFVVNEKAELVPRIAESYDMSDDGLTYTVHLRDGVKWQDGAPLTADDVLFYFDYYPRIESVDKAYDYSNLTVEKVDELTVRFRLAEMDATFAYTTLTLVIFLPSHIWKDIDPASWDQIADLSRLIGNGPFVLAEREEGGYLRLDRFEDFWEHRPYLDSVVLQIIPDNDARAMAFESKQVQLAMGNYQTTYMLLKDNPEYSFLLKPSANLGIFEVNHNDPLMSQLPMRKVVSYLIDRESLIMAQKNGATVLDSAFTPVDQYYNPAVADPEAFEFSVDKAAAILDAEGWAPGADGIREKDGQRLQMEIMTSVTNDPNAVILQDTFKKAGIELTYRPVDSAVYSDLVYTTQEYQIAGTGSGPSVGPISANYELVFTPSPYYNYDNPVVTQAFADAKNSVDPAVQKQAFELIQKTITEDRAQILTWNTPRIWGTNSGLNVDDAGFSGIYPPWVDFSMVYFEK